MRETSFRAIVAAVLASALVLPACLVEEVKVGGEGGDGGRGGAGGAGGTNDPAWSCVGDGGPPQDPPVATVRFTVLDPFTRLPMRGVRVRECAALDVTCGDPITDYQTVDTTGVASLPVPTNQDVYFEIVADDRVPTLAFFSRHEVARGGGGRGVLMFTAGQMGALLNDVGGFDPERPSNALLLGVALDCEGRVREGISFTLDPAEARNADTMFFYTNDDNVPVASATQTSRTGMFGANKLNVGPASVSLAANAPPANYAEVKVHLRQGWVTQAFVTP